MILGSNVFFQYCHFSESMALEKGVSKNQETDIKNTIESERIILSSKIAADCPFFL